MTLPKAAQLIEEFLSEYIALPDWDVRRGERILEIVPMVLEHVEGDILEIGALAGHSTKLFCEMADKFDRHVHVIDPWNGAQQGTEGMYQDFMRNVSTYRNLTVHRFSSQTIDALAAVEDKRFAFLLIDGLHETHAIQHDFLTYRELVNPGGIICADDWTGPHALSVAVRTVVSTNLDDNYHLLTRPNTLLEAYIVRKQ